MTPEQLKKIVKLRDEEGLQFKVIAQRFGKRPSTIKHHYLKAKEEGRDG